MKTHIKLISCFFIAVASSFTASLFTITTQTTSSKGAKRTTQVVYGTNEAP